MAGGAAFAACTLFWRVMYEALYAAAASLEGSGSALSATACCASISRCATSSNNLQLRPSRNALSAFSRWYLPQSRLADTMDTTAAWARCTRRKQGRWPQKLTRSAKMILHRPSFWCRRENGNIAVTPPKRQLTLVEAAAIAGGGLWCVCCVSANARGGARECKMAR